MGSAAVTRAFLLRFCCGLTGAADGPPAFTLGMEFHAANGNTALEVGKLRVRSRGRFVFVGVP